MASDSELRAAAEAHGAGPVAPGSGSPRAACCEALTQSRRGRDTLRTTGLALAAALLLTRLMLILSGDLLEEDLCPSAAAIMDAAPKAPPQPPVAACAAPMRWHRRAAPPGRVVRRGVGYSASGDDLDDHRARTAAAAARERSHALLEDRRHVCAALEAVIRAASIRNDCLPMPTFELAPLAVLAEGGLAHVLHSMLIAEPIGAMATAPVLSEAPFRLATAAMLAPPLAPLLLMPAGRPPLVTERRLGVSAGGATVADALSALERAAHAFDNKADALNEINEDGLHVGVDSMLQFVLYVSDTAARVKEVEAESLVPAALPSLRADGAGSAPAPAAASVAADAAAGARERAAHEAALRRVAVISVPLIATHAFRSHARQLAVTSSSAKARSREVMRAVSALETNLPISWSSSVHVATDEARLDVLRVLILPDDATPYANGAFLFDAFMPADFPCKPPQMKFLTTGSGSVRFNPNLYNDGKVCLSLLGTWSGPSWDPATSTFLQILVSLQAMVFCPKPYFNEPAYYEDEGSHRGDADSARYNADVRHKAARFAILEPLQKPLSGPWAVFKDVLRLHWRANRAAIKAQVLSGGGVPEQLAQQVCTALDEFEATLAAAEKEAEDGKAAALERQTAATRRAEEKRLCTLFQMRAGGSVSGAASAMDHG